MHWCSIFIPFIRFVYRLNQPCLLLQFPEFSSPLKINANRRFNFPFQTISVRVTSNSLLPCLIWWTEIQFYRIVVNPGIYRPQNLMDQTFSSTEKTVTQFILLVLYLVLFITKWPLYSNFFFSKQCTFEKLEKLNLNDNQIEKENFFNKRVSMYQYQENHQKNTKVIYCWFLFFISINKVNSAVKII